MDKKEVQQMLLQKMAERWAKKNPKMMEDLRELSEQVVLFNTKWGTSLKAEDVLNTKSNH